MNTTRPCGCKGVRTCLKCEEDFNIEKASLHTQLQELHAYSFCPACERLFEAWNPFEVRAKHPEHNGEEGLPFPGLYVQEQFISASEGELLMESLDALPWTTSQSGRRKQNFGPKTNFRQRKLRNGNFNGFPEGTRFVQERLRQVSLLSDFQTIEQCSLEYESSKGASIDPHVDDCWVWGERVVTLNCLGDAVLTLTAFDASAKPTKYNLNLVKNYEKQLILPLYNKEEFQHFDKKVIRVPMPNLSLIVMYGPPRYQFEHSVLREDIKERRVCIAYREFTPMYIEGEDKIKGFEVTKNAQNFWTDINVD
ncbi:alpha-ketoglutarate-dependent dioxygenase alkB homolog 4-like [Rhagoletis pomonella]|uniref:alpha-ketoglutarate-dependent dioxygenase alkB homolog 4-like n=1 Tax=Rhagoletis pomonella TaxID=28610 RepID=UPI00177A9ECD|nr:alpha-ketoglutarate-dependent dioxygenase alkB homolog 4-like [Rhagoletis pomonella]XP_036341393.1 alpha-ketoglutarate-dependent dioxygenase alkB homolog 4-like [Rhagoletis pomonella]